MKNNKAVTINEVAKLAGVSPSTVSYVINNSRFVSEHTRKNIQNAMRELDYRPNRLARSLRKGETHNIGIIIPSISNPFFAELGEEIESAAFKLGYNSFLCNTEDNCLVEAHYLEMLVDKQVDGIIYFPAQGNPKNLQYLVDHPPYPAIVIVDRLLHFTQFNSVVTDNVQGAYLATKHLIQLGHCVIGCIAGFPRFSATSERISGYLNALAEAGIETNNDLICQTKDTSESSKACAKTLIEKQPKLSAIFAANDIMAFGAFRAVIEKGLNIPKDIAIIGYDNIKLTSYSNPPISTIEQPKKEIAQTAIQLLITQIRGDSFKQQNVVLQPKLVIRESTIGWKGGKGKVIKKSFEKPC